MPLDFCMMLANWFVGETAVVQLTSNRLYSIPNGLAFGN